MWIGQRPVAIRVHLAIDIVHVPPKHTAEVALIYGGRPGRCALRSRARHRRSRLFAILCAIVLNRLRLLLWRLRLDLLLRLLLLAYDRDCRFVDGLFRFRFWGSRRLAWRFCRE